MKKRSLILLAIALFSFIISMNITGCKKDKPGDSASIEENEDDEDIDIMEDDEDEDVE